MKTLFFILCCMLLAMNTQAQTFETFEYTYKDSIYVMQKYYVVFLKTGPNRSQSKEEADIIQKNHLAYLDGLAEKGLLIINGPMGDDGDIKGISLYRVATFEEAQRLASQDPAVLAGRLIVEVHPWWLARGSKTY